MKKLEFSKVAALLIALTMVISTAACGSNGGSSEDTSATTGSSVATTSTAVEKVDPLAKYDTPIEITAVRAIDSTVKFFNGDTIDNNIWTKYYMDKLGIKIKYLWVVDSTEYKQKLNIAIASNELPDILQGEIDQMSRLNDNESLLPLDELYDKYASDILKGRMMEDGGIQLGTAKMNDKLMALPSTTSALDNAQLLWIRTDWLKNLNLEPPKTMEDVLNISKAFTTQDPDKNSKNDTYGLAVSKDFILTNAYASLDGFFNGYLAYPSRWIKTSDGKIAYGSIQPEMKTALASLQAMYKNGELDKEFGVKAPEKAMELVGSGKIGMQYGAMWNSLYPALQAPRDTNPAADWDSYTIPTVGDKPSVVPLSIPTYNYFAVNKACKYPEAMIKILNLDCTPETMNNADLQSNADFDSIWKYAFIGTSSPNQNIIQTREVGEALKTGDTSKFSMPASEKQTYDSLLKYTKGTEADKKDNTNWGIYKVFGENGSQIKLGKYLDENRLLYNIFYGAPTTTMTAKKASLDKIEIETFTKIIMGKSSIDEFDKFVSDYKKLGGDDITKEVNDWYSSK